MNTFDVDKFIDEQRIRPTHIVILLVCVLVCFIDGFDIFMIGKIAPAIAEAFGEPTEAMTFLFLCQQIGLAAGAFVVAPMADRYGRRLMLMLACAAFGTITLASVYAQSLTQLAILRGLAGIFMSAGLPMALALISELTPRYRRSTFIAIALAGYSSGSAASGIVAAWLLDSFGWQSGFWIGGMVPLLCIPLLLLFVPESLKHKVGRDPQDPSIPHIVRKLDSSVRLTGDERFIAGSADGASGKMRLTGVFADGRLSMTAIIWICCMLSMGNIALLAAWLPSFFQEMAGVPIQYFAILAMIAYIGGVFGTLSIGYLMDRVRATRLIPFYYIGISIALVALGRVDVATWYFTAVLIVWSFMQTGGQAGLNTLVTQVYPPSMRSTALGWSGGAGRIGGVISPIFGGVAIAQNLSLELTLICIAIPPIIVALLVFLLDYLGIMQKNGAQGSR